MTKNLRILVIAMCMAAATQLPAAPATIAPATSTLAAATAAGDLDPAPRLVATARSGGAARARVAATQAVSARVAATHAVRTATPSRAAVSATSRRPAGSVRPAVARTASVAKPALVRSARPARTASISRAPSTGRLNWNLNNRPRPPAPEPEPVSIRTKMLELQRLAATLPAEELAATVVGSSAPLPLPGFGGGIGGACYPSNQFTIAPGTASGLSFGFGSGAGDIDLPSAPTITGATGRVLYFFNQLVLGNAGSAFSPSTGFMQGQLVGLVLWNNPRMLPTVFASTCVVKLGVEGGVNPLIGGTFEGLVLGLPGQTGFTSGVATFQAEKSTGLLNTDFRLGISGGLTCAGTLPQFELDGNANGLLSIPSGSGIRARGSLPVGVTPGPAPCSGIVL